MDFLFKCLWVTNIASIWYQTSVGQQIQSIIDGVVTIVFVFQVNQWNLIKICKMLSKKNQKLSTDKQLNKPNNAYA